MKTRIVKNLLFSASLASALMSCSKKEDLQPTVATSPTTNAQVKVVNGRLVFADLAAFNKTFDAVATIGNSESGAQELAKWENNLRFSSLRASANAQIGHLEELDSQGSSAPAYDLMTKFGFPVAYAALINPSGEYQIGDKIYWFHEGFKYQADSEENLASIKKDPASATTKFAAGFKIQTLPNTSGRTTAYNDPYCDDKYSNSFGLNNDGNSQRRIIYGINVFTEELPQPPGGFYNNYRSTLNLFIKYEYYSSGKRKWYPREGEAFAWRTNFTYDATINAPYIVTPAPSTHYAGSNQQGTYSNGLYSLTLASDQFYTSTVDPYLNASQIKWNFNIDGSISGNAVSDPNNTFIKSGSPLW